MSFIIPNTKSKKKYKKYKCIFHQRLDYVRLAQGKVSKKNKNKLKLNLDFQQATLYVQTKG